MTYLRLGGWRVLQKAQSYKSCTSNLSPPTIRLRYFSILSSASHYRETKIRNGISTGV